MHLPNSRLRNLICKMETDQDEDMKHKQDNYNSTDEEGGFSHKCSGSQKCFFGEDKSLTTVWAAVQTELLTYRRLAEADP